MLVSMLTHFGMVPFFHAMPEVLNLRVATQYRAVEELLPGRENVLGKMSIFATVLFIVCSLRGNMQIYIDARFQKTPVPLRLSQV